MVNANITKNATSGIYGFIDSIDEKGISGWILDLDGGVNVVEVYINDVKVGEKEANLHRKDIDAMVGKETNCGFFIPWKEIRIIHEALSSHRLKLEILHARTKKIIAAKYKLKKKESIKQPIRCTPELSQDFINTIGRIYSENSVEHGTLGIYIKLHQFNVLRGGVGLVCFVHYDKDALIDEYVKYYISSLKSFGYDVFFVSTSNIDIDKYYDFMKTNCVGCIIRDNIGYDFYSYKMFYNIVRTHLGSYETFLLVNDSVYLISEELLHNFLQKLNYKLFKENLDCVGALSSCERAYHLQSWFLGFKTSDSILKFMDNFMGDLTIQHDKEKIINYYEVGLSQKLLQNEFKIGALYEYSSLVSALCKDHPYYKHACKHYTNPSHFFWDVLIRLDFPFVKRELLVKNPSNIVNIDSWKELCMSKGNTDFIKAIENNIWRLKDGNSTS